MLLLLKVILLELGLQTNATIIKYKNELSKLPILMATLTYTVQKFNCHVLGIILALKRNGSQAPYLITDARCPVQVQHIG